MFINELEIIYNYSCKYLNILLYCYKVVSPSLLGNMTVFINEISQNISRNSCNSLDPRPDPS